MNRKFLYFFVVVLFFLILLIVAAVFLINGNPVNLVFTPGAQKPEASGFTINNIPRNIGDYILNDRKTLIFVPVKLNDIQTNENEITIKTKIRPGIEEKFLVYKKEWTSEFSFVKSRTWEMFPGTDQIQYVGLKGIINIESALSKYKGGYVFITLPLDVSHTDGSDRQAVACNDKILKFLSAQNKSFPSCDGMISELQIYDAN